jgi:alanyl-tRNA synthetase
MTGFELRRKFLDYFIKNGHVEVPSSSLIPENDPTLLFANAGMNQFKNIFMGKEKRPYKRACSCQKVVRAGGKHNDLENVGKTARHHTFFEMLGNFSFGDYFKKEAITYAWDFLTNHLQLDKSKLYATVYYDDDEAFNIWLHHIGLEKDRIVKKGEKDNFWAMGDTGPCGPCSEIIIDQGVEVGCKRPECDINCDCDRFLELWNLVFMQFNRDQSGNLLQLPHPCIDTGMGLERITAIMQNVKSNYDTDLFMPIINYIANISTIKYGSGGINDVAIRVIADHSRAATFIIGDGVIPSNESRGYVLRRIIRRALRYGKIINIEMPFFYKICEFVVDFMKNHYIELADKKEYISSIVKEEESKFSEILESGLKIVDNILNKYKVNKVIPGEEIFKLYDTYGFPVDLLNDIALENYYTLDLKGFEEAMEEQRNLARQGTKITVSNINEIITGNLSENYNSKFIGYERDQVNTKILTIISNNREVDELKEGQKGYVILAETPFYPEMGGQISDTGYIKNRDAIAKVLSTFKNNNNEFILNEVIVEKGLLKKSQVVEASIDIEKRREIEKHHTATHLLHRALRQLFGEHVRQYGSLVDNSHLRFDFNLNKPLENHEIEKLERLVNEKIQENLKVTKKIVTYDEAIKNGAIALFGEKYGSEVRVVEINDYSKELCGGCHVNATGQLGVFKIISEGSIASGIRRIEAICGKAAIDHIIINFNKIKTLASIIECHNNEIEKKVEELINTNKKLAAQNRTLTEKLILNELDKNLDKYAKLTNKDYYVVAMELKEVDISIMRSIMDKVKNKLEKSVILLYNINKEENRVVLLCGVTRNMTNLFDASLIAQKIAQVIGGSGGGKKEIAQAGSKNIREVNKAIELFYSIVGGSV